MIFLSDPVSGWTGEWEEEAKREKLWPRTRKVAQLFGAFVSTDWQVKMRKENAWQTGLSYVVLV